MVTGVTRKNRATHNRTLGVGKRRSTLLNSADVPYMCVAYLPPQVQKKVCNNESIESDQDVSGERV